MQVYRLQIHVSNISTNYWITNSSLNSINTCLQNISLNYWKTNTSLSSINTCLSNISTNYWITNNSLLNVNNCLANISTNYWITNASLLNLSSNYWITNASVLQDNVCLNNVSTNYWITNASLLNLSNYAGNVSTRLYDTNAIAIASLAEVNVLAATLAINFVLDELGNPIGGTFNQDNNNTDIMCRSLTAYTSITSEGTINGNSATITNGVGCYTLNSHYIENSVSLSSGRMYCANDLHVGNDLYHEGNMCCNNF